MKWELDTLMPTVEALEELLIFDNNPNKPIARPRELQLLAAFARSLEGVDYAIETGSYSGSFAQALRFGCGVVISIDNYSHPNIRKTGPGIFTRRIQDWDDIHFIWGDGKRSLPDVVTDLVQDNSFLFFHDSDHSYDHVLAELRLARDLGAKGIACHDIEDWEEELKTGTAFKDFLAESPGWDSYIEGNIGLARRS